MIGKIGCAKYVPNRADSAAFALVTALRGKACKPSPSPWRLQRSCSRTDYSVRVNRGASGVTDSPIARTRASAVTRADDAA